MCVRKRDLFCSNLAFIPIEKFQSSLSDPFGTRKYIYTQVKYLGFVAGIYAMQKVNEWVALERCSLN